MSVARELADLPSASPSTDANFDNGTFVIDVSTDRVGIGSTAPAELLSVVSASAATRGMLEIKNTSDNAAWVVSDANLSGAGSGMGGVRQYWNGTEVTRIASHSGADTTNKDDGELAFYTRASGAAIGQRMIINAAGNIGIGATPAISGTGNVIMVMDSSNVGFHMKNSGTTKISLYSNGDSYFNGGSVGIGVAAPASLLHVAGTVQVGVDGTGHDVFFYGDDAGSYFQYDQSADKVFIKSTDSGGGTSYTLAVEGMYTLFTKATVSNGYAARFERDMAEAGTDPCVNIIDDNTNNTQTTLRLQQDGTGDLVNFFDGGTEVFTILNGGNVGIATTAPASLLDVRGSIQQGVDGTGHDMVWYSDTSGRKVVWDGTNARMMWDDNTKITIGTGSDLNIYHNGTDSIIQNDQGALRLAAEDSGIAVIVGHTTSEVTIGENLTVNGSVGIGTTAPDNELHIHKASCGSNQSADASTLFVLENSTTCAMQFLTPTGNACAINFGDPDANLRGSITYHNSGDTMYFHVAGSVEVMRFLSDGKVGIGTTTPVTSLTVDGTLTLKERAEADTNTATYGQLWVNTATPNELYFTADDDTDIQITTATGINAASTGKAIAMAMVFGG